VKVAIAGGKLQGVEAAYLSSQAGWSTVLIDKKKKPPAAGLCSSFYCMDIIRDYHDVKNIMVNVDLIIPAIEDTAVLKLLQKISKELKIPLAYDEKSYYISHSKKRSNRLFKKLGVIMPGNWPDCKFPVIAKPSLSSGSRHVLKIDNNNDMNDFKNKSGRKLKEWILQEYVEGPSYSVEVLGLDGKYKALQVTELGMDDNYDCNRVLAPAEIPNYLEKQIKEIAVNIAESLNLKGIMDVEFIFDKGVLKILEIDARLPSQTPTAVYKSIQLNMIESIADIFIKGFISEIPEIKSPGGVIYEHIKVWKNRIDFPGEHAIGSAGLLKIVTGFFGSDSAITNFEDSKFPWVATLICTGKSRQQALFKRNRVIENIRQSIN